MERATRDLTSAQFSRLALRVDALEPAVRFYVAIGFIVTRREQSVVTLANPAGHGAEIVLHCDPRTPKEVRYVIVPDVAGLYKARQRLNITFIQPPLATLSGMMAVIRDPSGHEMHLIDRSGGAKSDDGRAEMAAAVAVRDLSGAGPLFGGVEATPKSRPDDLVTAYLAAGRSADDLPYTPDFENFFSHYAAGQPKTLTRQLAWKQLLNLRKTGKLPRITGKPGSQPKVSAEERAELTALLGDTKGKRDRLPYSPDFDRLLLRYNSGTGRRLSPYQFWRLVALVSK